MHATLLTLLLAAGAEPLGTIAEQPAVGVTAEGCYPGNNRHMYHYPAFHGDYYRRPYNYRHLFDYPWHAAPHAPQGFSTFPCGQSAGEVIRTPQNEPDGARSLQPIPSSPAMPDPTY